MSSITAHFARQLAEQPDAVAVEHKRATLTYGELERRANQLAHCLQKRGVGPDAIVALSLDRNIDLAVSVLAVLKAGGACLPVDADYPAARLAFVLADARPMAV